MLISNGISLVRRISSTTLRPSWLSTLPPPPALSPSTCPLLPPHAPRHIIAWHVQLADTDKKALLDQIQTPPPRDLKHATAADVRATSHTLATNTLFVCLVCLVCLVCCHCLHLTCQRLVLVPIHACFRPSPSPSPILHLFFWVCI